MWQLTTALELELLKKYARQARLGIIEIGVFDGGTTRHLIDVSTVPVYGIDPMIPDSNDECLIGNLQTVNEIHSDRFAFFRDYSHNVVNTFKYTVDFIFIDGDHNSDAVKKDFEDWGKILEKGGIVAFHDTTLEKMKSGKPGVAKFINEEMLLNKDYELIDSADSIKVFRRI